jgi:hypothetical protein
MPNARYLRLKGATGTIRTAMFQNREHLVVPVTMLVEGVVWAGNSPRPELVTAEELSIAPEGWNGRPCVGGHPRISGEFVSANLPTVLERELFGHLFDSRVEDKRLLADAWIDPAEAEKTETGKEVVRRLQANPPEMVEVSVGAYIISEDRSGTYNGKKYEGQWRHIVPDHLAFLAEGEKGACSNEMGCGAPRVSISHLVTNTGIEVIGEEPVMADTPAPVPQRTMKDRILDFIGFRRNVMQSDLNMQLDSLLRPLAGYIGLDDIDLEKKTVTYFIMTGENWQIFRQGYTVKDGKVELKGEAEEVRMKTQYVPVAATAASESECGCHKSNASGDNAMNKEQRIAALISTGRFTEADRNWLTVVPEDRLSALEQQPSPQPGTTTTAPSPAAPAPAPPPAPAPTSAVAPVISMTTAEQFIANLPSHEQETSVS